MSLLLSYFDALFIDCASTRIFFLLRRAVHPVIIVYISRKRGTAFHDVMNVLLKYIAIRLMREHSNAIGNHPLTLNNLKTDLPMMFELPFK